MFIIKFIIKRLFIKRHLTIFYNFTVETMGNMAHVFLEPCENNNMTDGLYPYTLSLSWVPVTRWLIKRQISSFIRTANTMSVLECDCWIFSWPHLWCSMVSSSLSDFVSSGHCVPFTCFFWMHKVCFNQASVCFWHDVVKNLPDGSFAHSQS